MSADNYRQFTLERPSPEGGTMRAVYWLPERKGAVEIDVGARISLDGEPGVIWTVAQRSQMTLTQEEVRSMWANARDFGPSLDERDRVTG